MIKVCESCGKTFKSKASRPDIKCCSFICSGIWRSKNIFGANHPSWNRISKNCERCGKSFFPKRNQLDYRKYCSIECKVIATTTIQPRLCKFCGNEFTPKGQRDSIYFCSTNCYHSFATKENHPRWNGGTSYEPYPITFDKKFKEFIRNRDNNTCAICKGIGKDVHHINYVKMDTTPENCVTLCRSCHAKTNSNRDYWVKYFSSC